MRETLSFNFSKALRFGITPAYAGNTSVGHFPAASGQDHPRVCGKHLRSISRKPCDLGSPPRMRETLGQRIDDFNRIGITPAYAGNTELEKRVCMMSQDHPRVCGKHVRRCGFV